jgi:hypothetical protein
MDKKAFAFAGDAIAALGEGDGPLARTCVSLACELDPAMNHLADAVFLACSELDSKGEVSTSTWDSLGEALGTGELIGIVEAHRTS